MNRRMLVLSYFAFTAAGRLHTSRTGVGAEKVVETRYFSTRRSQSSASNFFCSTTVLPRPCATAMNPPGPEWYSGPVVRYTSFGE